MKSEPAATQECDSLPAHSPHRGDSFATAGAIFAGGNLLSSVLRAAAGILLVRIVSPGVLGLFNSAALVTAYAPVLQLGVWNGLGREIPFHTGRGDRKYAGELAAAAHAWSLMMALAVALVLAGIAARSALQGEWIMAALWATNAAVSFLLVGIQNYLEATFRTSGQFARLSLATVLQSVLALVFLPLVAWLGIWGLCLRVLAITALYCGTLWRWRPLPVPPRFHWTQVKQLLKIGLPIFAVGELWRGWTVLDTTLVLRNLGTESVGLYSLAAMANMPFVLLVGSVSQMVYPRMTECYGRTGRLDEVYRAGVRPTLLLVLLMAPVLAASWVLLPPVIHLLAPKYVGGIEAAQWSVLAQGVLAFRPMSNVFNVVKRQDLALATVITGAVVYLVGLAWLGRDGYQLVHFPLAMLMGNTVYILASYLCLYFLLRRGLGPLPPSSAPSDGS